jgi:hypothetical protein
MICNADRNGGASKSTARQAYSRKNDPRDGRRALFPRGIYERLEFRQPVFGPQQPSEGPRYLPHVNASGTAARHLALELSSTSGGSGIAVMFPPSSSISSRGNSVASRSGRRATPSCYPTSIMSWSVELSRTRYVTGSRPGRRPSRSCSAPASTRRKILWSSIMSSSRH